MVMIAGIYKGKDRVGFRILDADANKTMDAPDSAVITAIKNGHTILNLCIANGELKGSNGDISRFAKVSLNGGALIGTDKAPIVIINQLGDFGYTASDHNGKIMRAATDNVIEYASKFGIANGKVSNKNGVPFISAISGTYEVVVTDIRKKETTEVVNNIKPETKKEVKHEVTQSNTTNIVSKSASIETDNTGNRLDILNDEQKSALKEYIVWSKLSEEDAEAEIEYIVGCVENGKNMYQKSDTPLLIEILHLLRDSMSFGELFGEGLARVIIIFIQTKLAFTRHLVEKISERLLLDPWNSCEHIMYTFYSYRAHTTVEYVVRKLNSGVNYTFIAAADAYIKILFSYGLLKYFGIKEIDPKIKADIKEYAGCETFDLIELRALMGVLSYMQKIEDTIFNSVNKECTLRPNTHLFRELVAVYAHGDNESVEQSIAEVVDMNVAFTEHWLEIDKHDKVINGINIDVCGTICDLKVSLGNKDIKRVYARYISKVGSIDECWNKVIKFLNIIRISIANKVKSASRSVELGIQTTQNKLQVLKSRGANVNRDYTDLNNKLTHIEDTVVKDNISNTEVSDKLSELKNELNTVKEGGQQLTNEIKDTVNKLWDNAEQIKCEYTVSWREMDQNRIDKANSLLELEQALIKCDELSKNTDEAIANFEVTFEALRDTIANITNELCNLETKVMSLRTSELPSRQMCKTVDKTDILEAIKHKSDISKFDQLEVYEVLKDAGLGVGNERCFEIAQDIFSKKIPYKKLSSKQKYRFDEAITKMSEELIGKQSVGSSGNAATTTVSKGSAEVNNKYILQDHPEITEKVISLIAKSDSVEMQEVLKSEPNVLKICYSILRYKSASDKQLAHVNNAIKLLDNQ